MKKIISLILAVSLVMSVFVAGTFSASATDTVLVSFDTLANFTTSFNTGMAIEANEIREGIGSMRMGFTIPIGQTAGVGGMMFYDFPTSQDLSAYDTFKIDVYVPGAECGVGNAERFQVNFVSDKALQDGFNYDLRIDNVLGGWNTFTFDKANPSATANSPSWSNINRIRITWFNDSQVMNRTFFLLDNLRASTESTQPPVSSTPVTEEDGSTLLLDFDNGQGYTPISPSTAGLEYTLKTQGNGSFKWGTTNPTGSGMLFYDYPSGAQDFTNYNSFKLDVYIPLERTNAGGMLQMNFCSPGGNEQDGYNFDIPFATLKQGWNTITINKSESGGPGADWSQIYRFRWYWMNDNQESIEYFLFDNLRGCVSESSSTTSSSTTSSTTSSEVVDTSIAHTPYVVDDNDIMIHNADSLNGWSRQFWAEISTGKKHVEGEKSVAMTSTIANGQANNIGAMAFVDFPDTDLSAYQYISFKVRIDTQLIGDHILQLNFVTGGSEGAQDGFNFGCGELKDKNAGWYHIIVKMSEIQNATGAANWSSIDRIRFTWWNHAQISNNVEFIFDDIRAHKTEPEKDTRPVASEDPKDLVYAPDPYEMEDGSLMINNCDSTTGWAGYIETLIYRHPTIRKEGSGAISMTGKQVMGNAGNSGSMSIIEFKDFDLTDYEHFEIKVYNQVQLEGKNMLQVNFITRTGYDLYADQDGFNFEFDMSEWEAKRWYILRFSKDDFEAKTDIADWSSIGRIRITWFNQEQIETSAALIIDDIRAYPENYQFDPLPPEFINGDVSRDDIVNSADALLALQYSVGKVILTTKQRYIADVCSPSGVDAVDALTILQLVVKKINELDNTYSKASVVSTYVSYEPEPVDIPSTIVKNNAYGKDGDDGSDKSFKTETLGIKPRTVYVVQAAVPTLSLQHGRLVYSLQGLMNRDFGLDDEHTSVMFVNKDASDGAWLEYFTTDSESSPFYGFDVVRIGSWTTFFRTFKPMIEKCGYIAWDPAVPATANVAATICGLDGYLPVMSGSALETELLDKGIEKKMTLVGKFTGATTGSAKNDAYRWALDNYFNRCSYDYVAYTVDGAPEAPGNVVAADGDVAVGICLDNHDYLIARRAFFFDLDPYAAAKAEDSSKTGIDHATLRMILDRRYTRANGKIGAFMGFVPWWLKYASECGNATAGPKLATWLEWYLSELCACYNIGKEADAAFPASMTNGSVSYKYTITDPLVNKNHPKYTGTTKVTEYNSNIHYFSFYVGDYDSSAWLKNYVTKFWMGEATRGKVDLMWSINPNLINRVPMCFEYMYDNLTDCDYMAAGEGAGYFIPLGLFPNKTLRYLGASRPYAESGSQAYIDYATPLYQLCDMDITGFMIMGDPSNAMTTGVADMYRAFSPAAVFHQSTWGFAKRGDTPFIICRQEDIKVGENWGKAYGAYSHSFSVMEASGVNFSMFRTITQSPTDLKALAESYTAYCAGRGKTVQYVDPYSFIALAKKSGKLTSK